ncbi:hypothetical protein DYBT9275_03159 [Dyadobacter sp. CECT 9275]|uniref:Uncharacterized protein n=1 Tax=Dyadobacter helix TaxID=2822344 RepID=A0A916NLZ5_9BACT|nr:hypothetical protein DYBT9275_03159 [Dyadobacter sp. CECT 9275]
MTSESRPGAVPLSDAILFVANKFRFAKILQYHTRYIALHSSLYKINTNSN